MMNLTQRLGTLDHKAKAATRTAKDGEEYSQLVFELCDVEMTDTEINAIFASPQAYRAITALGESVKGIKAIELEEKIDGATVRVQLAALNASNGPQFTFTDCRIDKLKLSPMLPMLASFRVTSKPALDGKFGELIARLGHTVMVEVHADSPFTQDELPLNSMGANEHGTSSIGTPEQERESARKRERKIQQDADAMH